MKTTRDLGGRGSGSRTGRFRGLLRVRIWIYVLILIALAGVRFYPDIRSKLAPYAPERTVPNEITMAGVDTAPTLIPQLVEAYRQIYPEIRIRLLPGGTRQALEDLFNKRAQVAFTCRMMTAEESSIVRAAGDTALSFPIALGGIAILASRRAVWGSISVPALRAILQGVPPVESIPPPQRLYAPDPNLGIWTALTAQLDVPEDGPPNVLWLASDLDVVRAVEADTECLGVASTLALPPDLDRRGVRTVPVVRQESDARLEPNETAVATGGYPLYHYVYVSCRPDGGPLAAGFVSFMHSGRGQRLVGREGFLPARDVPREVILSRRPVTGAS